MSYEMCYQQNIPAVMSKTDQYRKVMKPLLERKRRARINRCLDELKDLMVSALETGGDNVQKLEKADILELTVRHLHKVRRQEQLAKNPVVESDRFKAGYKQCAMEVSRCLSSIPGVDVQLGTHLMTQLGHNLRKMETISPITITVPTPPCSPVDGNDYPMPLTPISSRGSSINSPAPEIKSEVWRPW